MGKIISNTVSIYQHSESILIKPIRWCFRNVSNLNKAQEDNLLKKAVIKISQTAIAILSILALAVTIPLASVGIFWELLRGKQYHHRQMQTDLQRLAKHQLATMTPEELDSNWTLKELFGQIFVINLENAKEKRVSFAQNVKEVGLNEEDFTFFKATNGRTELPQSLWSRVDNNYCDIDCSTVEGREKLDKQHQGQAGCYMSHYRVIKEAKRLYEDAWNKVETAKNAYNKSPSPELLKQLKEAEIELQKKSKILIMEDDNAFGKVINTEPALHEYNRAGDKATLKGLGTTFRQGLTELPIDWDMIYLHSYQIFPDWEGFTDPNKKICELKGGLTCNAYIVSAKAFDKILSRLEKIEKGNSPLYPIDDEFAKMHREGYLKAYGFQPSIAYQNCMGQSSIAEQGDQVAAQKKCWQQFEWGRPALTYAGDGQRFGDKLINYIKALWIADQHKIPLVYNPFKYADELMLSQSHVPYKIIAKKYRVITNEVTGYDPEKPLTSQKWNELLSSSRKFFKSLNNWKSGGVAQLFKASFFTPMNIDDCDNENFRLKLQSLIKPINPITVIDPPKDCCSIALHVRKGGGYDSITAIQSMPTKFPPDQYYIDAIKFLANSNKGRKLYIHLFTDDPNPQSIVDRYNEAIRKLDIKNEIEFSLRRDQNNHNSNVLEDFFGMTNFECLVRGDSSFSQAVEILSGPRISITPPGWDEWKQRDVNGNVIADRFKVNMRSQKGKGRSTADYVYIK